MAPSCTSCLFPFSLIDIIPLAEVVELARLLRINLDPDTLSICCQLLEDGANPEALAALIVELQSETSRMKS